MKKKREGYNLTDNYYYYLKKNDRKQNRIETVKDITQERHAMKQNENIR